MGRCQDVAAQPSTQHSGGEVQQLANSGNNAFLIQYIFSCGEILTLLGRHKYIACNNCQTFPIKAFLAKYQVPSPRRWSEVSLPNELACQVWSRYDQLLLTYC